MEEPQLQMLMASNSKEVEILLYFEFEYRKGRTIKGDTMLKLICATKYSNIPMHPQIHSKDSLHFTLTLAVLRGATLPHFKRGTAALKPRYCHDLSDRWG